jgi:hypothetical protein
MSGAASTIFPSITGALINGIGTNILAGGDTKKGLLMNAALLAGSKGLNASPSALSSAGASNATNTMFANPAGVNPVTLIGPSQTSPGIFSNVTAPLTASQPLSSAAGQTAGMERSFGALESMFNPNIQSSSLNNESFLESLGSGASQVGQYAQQNPVLTQMAMQSAQNMLQQQPTQPAPAGLIRGNPTQVQMPQYQVGVPQVSLI